MFVYWKIFDLINPEQLYKD